MNKFTVWKCFAWKRSSDWSSYARSIRYPVNVAIITITDCVIALVNGFLGLSAIHCTNLLMSLCDVSHFPWLDRGIIYAWDNDNQRQSYVMLTIHFQKRREKTWELKEIGPTKKVTPSLRIFTQTWGQKHNTLNVIHGNELWDKKKMSGFFQT